MYFWHIRVPCMTIPDTSHDKPRNILGFKTDPLDIFFHKSSKSFESRSHFRYKINTCLRFPENPKSHVFFFLQHRWRKGPFLHAHKLFKLSAKNPGIRWRRSLPHRRSETYGPERRWSDSTRLDVSHVVFGDVVMRAFVFPQHFFQLQKWATDHHYDLCASGDAAHREIHGRCAAHHQVLAARIWIQGVLAKSGAV